MISSLLLAVTIVAHEPGFVTSLANHLQRWLGEERVASTVVKPSGMSAALAKERLAFLVGFDSPTKGELATLRAFRARGGRLVVFHSGSAAIGAMMGVKPLGYRAAAYPGEFSRMDFTAARPAGAPAAIRQTSTAIIRAAPIKGQSNVLAYWSDRSGRPTGEAAWIASSAGYWMTHVLLADGDEGLKSRLLGAIAGSVSPTLWTQRDSDARRRSKISATYAYAAKQVPRIGEIRAVWDQSGCGLYPGNWPRTMQLLKASNVSDLFVNVAGAGYAHYPSAVVPQSATCRKEGDQLKAAIAAARGTGIRVHAWVICFSATRSSPQQLAAFRSKGWCLRNANGKLSEYLDPGNSAVRSHVISIIDEIQARYAVSGIHLDFVRWGDSAVKPKNAAETISRFVATARIHVKRPRMLTTAVYGKYPTCITTVGQDWLGWIDAGLVDYVVPMDYSDSLAKFAELVACGATTRNRSRRIIAGIGVTANESRLDAIKVIDQINTARRFGLAGTSLFDLDAKLESEILPYLKLGIWKSK